MEFSLADLGQALSDVIPTLCFTLALLLLLAGGAWVSGKRAQHKRLSLRRRQRMENVREKISHNEIEAADFWQGMSITLFGVIVTTVFFSMISLVFQQYQNIQNLKASLIRQMGNPSNGIAFDAVRQLSDLGWLYDDTLVGNDFHHADLGGAELRDANLAEINLTNADLTGADLTNANLRASDLTHSVLSETDFSNTQLDGAVMSFADFQGALLTNTNFRDAILDNVDLSQAIFHGQLHFDHASMRSVKLSDTNARGAYFIQATLLGANFQRSNLRQVNFYQANLRETSFRGANVNLAYFLGSDLRWADLRSADFRGAQLDETTILPDARQIAVPDSNSFIVTYSSYYDPEQGLEQLERFTNPDHEDFWDPCVENPNLWYCADEESGS